MSTPWHHHHLIRPFVGFKEVSGDKFAQRAAWEYNQERRHLLSQGAAIWLIASMVSLKIGGFLEEADMLPVALVFFLLTGFLIPGACVQMVAYLGLGRKFEDS